MLNCFNCVQLFATLWIIAHQAPLFMGLSKQEYWSGLPCPPPENLPDPGIEPAFLTSPTLSGRFFTTSPPGKPMRVAVTPKSGECVQPRGSDKLGVRESLRSHLP